MLLAKTNRTSHFVSVSLDRFALDNSISASWHQHTSKHVDSSCFSGSIVTKQGDDLVLLHTESHLVDGSELTELHGHFLELNRVCLEELATTFVLLCASPSLLIRAILDQSIGRTSLHILIIILNRALFTIDKGVIIFIFGELLLAPAEAEAARFCHTVCIRDDGLEVDVQEEVDGSLNHKEDPRGNITDIEVVVVRNEY